jgi:2-methylisocitrate lyase-like PEP mutase family enzyme
VRVVINAGTDVFLRQIGEPATRLQAAIERGRAYRDAGADCVFVPGVVDRATIGTLVAEIGAPINVLAVAGTPPVAELEALGVARVSLGSGPMRAAMALVSAVAQELKARGTYSTFTDRALSYDAVNELMKEK